VISHNITVDTQNLEKSHFFEVVAVFWV
jgi:hypothetical protein